MQTAWKKQNCELRKPFDILHPASYDQNKVMNYHNLSNTTITPVPSLQRTQSQAQISGVLSLDREQWKTPVPTIRKSVSNPADSCAQATNSSLVTIDLHQKGATDSLASRNATLQINKECPL